MSLFSRTRDWDFRSFYPCEIILSRIPVTARGKDKTQTVARRLHAACMSIRDVIVMLYDVTIVTSQRFQDYLEVFSCLCGT